MRRLKQYRSPRFDPQGDPMLLTFRRVLEECATVEEAEKLLRQTRHTTWFNQGEMTGQRDSSKVLGGGRLTILRR